MIRNAAIVVLAAGVVGLAAVTVSQRGELAKLRGEVAALTDAARARADAAAVARREEGAATARMHASRLARADMPATARWETAGDVPPVAAPPEPAAPLPPAAGAPTNSTPMAELSRMMAKSPAMREMIRSSQRSTMEMTHGSLFRYLQLDDEQLKAFQEMLLEKQMALLDVSLDMMGNMGGATSEERRKKTQQAADLSAEYDEKIKAFLGEDNYATYKDFESTQPERQQVSMFKMSLPADAPLTEEQEHSLIRTMYDARTNYHFSVRYDNSGEMDPAMFSPEAIAQYMKESSDMQAGMLTRAGTILSPAQMDSFRSSVEQQRAMTEMGMRMAAQMFGGQGAAAPSSDAPPAGGATP